MYEKGAVKWGDVMDSEHDYKDVTGAYLDHSCDDWVIGGEEQIRWLIVDLENLLRRKK